MWANQNSFYFHIYTMDMINFIYYLLWIIFHSIHIIFHFHGTYMFY